MKNKYHDIFFLVSTSTMFGRILVLDDMIQVTEKDSFVYQEMAAFLPLNSHPNPKKVTEQTIHNVLFLSKTKICFLISANMI